MPRETRSPLFAYFVGLLGLAALGYCLAAWFDADELDFIDAGITGSLLLAAAAVMLTRRPRPDPDDDS